MEPGTPEPPVRPGASTEWNNRGHEGCRDVRQTNPLVGAAVQATHGYISGLVALGATMTGVTAVAPIPPFWRGFMTGLWVATTMTTATARARKSPLSLTVVSGVSSAWAIAGDTHDLRLRPRRADEGG